MVATKALMSISLPRPLRTNIQPIRMRAISSNVSEVPAARLSVYDSVGCDDAVTDCIVMVALPFRFPLARPRRMQNEYPTRACDIGDKGGVSGNLMRGR